MAIYEKMINEAVGATKAVYSVIDKKEAGSLNLPTASHMLMRSMR